MFLNPIMLAGLAGAMLPLVLHLLSRARFRSVRWGAMIFLGGEDPVQSRRSRLREAILLAIRMLMVATLAIALARPVLAPAGEKMDGPACTVIILDRSASMLVEQNGPPRDEAARRAVLSVLSSLRRGDEAALIFTPEASNSPLPVPTNDLQFLGARLSDPNRLPMRANIPNALNRAAAVLARSHATFKNIVLVCDRQASNWTEVNDAFASAFRQSIRDASGQSAKLMLVPVGAQDAGNVAIESIQVMNPPIVRGVPVDIEVTIHNYDTIPCAALSMVLSSDQVDLHQATVNLNAGASTVVRCSAIFPEVGPKILVARISPHGLASDDTMEEAVEVTEPVGVLIVSGEANEGSVSPLQSAGDFLRLAMAPYQATGQIGADVAHVEIAAADNWPALDRNRIGVVVLGNVPRLSPRQVRQLEQFVYAGGGLLIAPGNLVRPDDYNEQLWRDGSSLLPAQLLPPTAVDGSQSTTLLGLDLSHPIFHFLRGRDEPIPRVMVNRYFPTGPLTQGARSLGHFASGQPFLIENSYGRGRVLLCTTPLDAGWNLLPLSSIYLPTLQSAIRYLAAGMVPDRNLWPGMPIVAMVDDPTEDRAYIEVPQGAASIPIDLLRVGDSYEARFLNTVRAGAYSLEIQTDRGVKQYLYAVRTPRDESDLAGLTPGQLGALQKMLGFEIVEPEAQAIANASDATRRRFELGSWLLMAAFGLALGELWLARIWQPPLVEAP